MTQLSPTHANLIIIAFYTQKNYVLDLRFCDKIVFISCHIKCATNVGLD